MISGPAELRAARRGENDGVVPRGAATVGA